jgi:murein DD-endopeptidase MepM/ murein hydrolase activator NlpD
MPQHMKKKRFFSFIFVPDQERDPKSYSMSYRKGWFLLALGVLLCLHTLAGAVAYYRVFRLEGLKRRLTAENEDLTTRNKRIDRIVREVGDMRQMEEKIRKAFGATLHTGGSSDAKAGPSGAAEIEPDAAASTAAATSKTSGAVYFLSRKQGGDFDPETFPTLLPVDGVLTTHFRDDRFLPGRNHWGIDIAAQKGTAIHAAGSGVVVMGDWTPDLGYLVILSHGGGWFTYYGHAQEILVEQGATVKKGQVIALLGSSGISSAPHLHFEIWHDGKPNDPEQLLYAVQKVK